MSDRTDIEWTDATWNPVTGCTKVSAGCDRCYAERFSERFRGVAGNHFAAGFDLTLRPHMLDKPLHWRRPRRIFVNSMSDLFHKDIPPTYLADVFRIMERADWHQYQVLTKRSSLMRDYVNERYDGRQVPAHIWLGVSVEDAKAKIRIRHLQQTNAAVRFLSIEPLIGHVGTLDLSGISWVICGGESGPGHRKMEEHWAVDVRDQAIGAGVPFFFKQVGGARPTSGGKLLRGREYRQFPVADEAADA